MRHLVALLFLAPLLFSTAACGQAAGESDSREARILANLKHEFPELGNHRVEIGEISPAEIEGLEEGSFTINGQQTQRFLITADDTKLWILAAPAIDASRTAEGLAAARAEREQAAERAVEERAAQLEAAVAGLPVRGNPDADVTIVEFSDFQCPYCSRAANTIEELLEERGDEVRFVYLQYPLGNHPWARPASIAALCAAQQDADAFWTLHDNYFANQRALNPGNVMAQSRSYLAGSGLDMEAWATCAEDTGSTAHQGAVAALDAQVALAQELGVTGTPGFFVNGQFVNGAQPLETFEALIESAQRDS